MAFRSWFVFTRCLFLYILGVILILTVIAYIQIFDISFRNKQFYYENINKGKENNIILVCFGNCCVKFCFYVRFCFLNVYLESMAFGKI